MGFNDEDRISKVTLQSEK